MQYLLSEAEYKTLQQRSEAINQIEDIINRTPKDNDGRVNYSYRFDKVMSQIMDVLDEVKIQTVQDQMWVMPWFRNTEELMEGLHV